MLPRSLFSDPSEKNKKGKSRTHKHHKSIFSFFFLVKSMVWGEEKEVEEGSLCALCCLSSAQRKKRKTLQNKFAALLKQANIELEQINIVFLYYVIIMDDSFLFVPIHGINRDVCGWVGFAMARL
jgi:hypothetical protein